MNLAGVGLVDGWGVYVDRHVRTKNHAMYVCFLVYVLCCDFVRTFFVCEGQELTIYREFFCKQVYLEI